MIGIEELAAAVVIIMRNRGVSRKKALEIAKEMNSMEPTKKYIKERDF